MVKNGRSIVVVAMAAAARSQDPAPVPSSCQVTASAQGAIVRKATKTQPVSSPSSGVREVVPHTGTHSNAPHLQAVPTKDSKRLLGRRRSLKSS